MFGLDTPSGADLTLTIWAASTLPAQADDVSVSPAVPDWDWSWGVWFHVCCLCSVTCLAATCPTHLALLDCSTLLPLQATASCTSTATVVGGQVAGAPLSAAACPAGSYAVTNEYCYPWCVFVALVERAG